MNNVFSQIAGKLETILSNGAGVFLLLVSSAVSFLGAEKMAFYALITATIVDMLFGIAVSLRNKSFIKSHLVRRTVFKIFVYVTLIFLLLFIERSVNADWGLLTRTVCAVGSMIELWSICGNILALDPEFPIIRLIRRYLAGEIAEKLKTDRNSVESDLNGKP